MIFNKKKSPYIVSTQKIDDVSITPSSPAITYFKGKWLCAFTDKGTTKHTIIKLFVSEDTFSWSHLMNLEIAGVYLSKPKFIAFDENELTLFIEATILNQMNEYVSMQSHISISSNGIEWPELIPILKSHTTVWEITKDDDDFFALTYSQKKDKWALELLVTRNGMDYFPLSQIAFEERIKSGVLAYHNNQLYAIITPEDVNKTAHVGTSLYPFQIWDWQVSNYYISDPAMISLPNSIWAAGTFLSPTPYGLMEKTVLFQFTEANLLEPMLVLPSGGETGHPSLFYRENQLWMAYFSSHERKPAIYLVLVQLP